VTPEEKLKGLIAEALTEALPAVLEQTIARATEPLIERLEAVERALDRLAGEATTVDAAEAARLLGVHRETVYRHADALGAIRLGDGPRPRLQFDLRRLRARIPTAIQADPIRRTEPSP
jgi:hypothetical protein